MREKFVGFALNVTANVPGEKPFAKTAPSPAPGTPKGTQLDGAKKPPPLAFAQSWGEAFEEFERDNAASAAMNRARRECMEPPETCANVTNRSFATHS